MMKFKCLGKSGTDKDVNLSCLAYRAIKKGEIVEVDHKQAKIIESNYGDSFVMVDDGELEIGDEIIVEGHDYVVEKIVDEDSYEIEKLAKKPDNKMVKTTKNKSLK